MRTHGRSRPPARCLKLLDLLSDYLDQELAPSERRRIEAHCRNCTRCKAVVSSLARTVALCRAAAAGTRRLPPAAERRARLRIVKLLRTKLRLKPSSMGYPLPGPGRRSLPRSLSPERGEGQGEG